MNYMIKTTKLERVIQKVLVDAEKKEVIGEYDYSLAFKLAEALRRSELVQETSLEPLPGQLALPIFS
jgi:hypothetical protein